jgi:hypothetical protein
MFDWRLFCRRHFVVTLSQFVQSQPLWRPSLATLWTGSPALCQHSATRSATRALLLCFVHESCLALVSCHARAGIINSTLVASTVSALRHRRRSLPGPAASLRRPDLPLLHLLLPLHSACAASAATPAPSGFHRAALLNLRFFLLLLFLLVSRVMDRLSHPQPLCGRAQPLCASHSHFVFFTATLWFGSAKA